MVLLICGSRIKNYEFINENGDGSLLKIKDSGSTIYKSTLYTREGTKQWDRYDICLLNLLIKSKVSQE